MITMVVYKKKRRIRLGRAEKRRRLKEKRKNANTYGIRKSELSDIVREKVTKEFGIVKEEAMNEAVNTAMLLLLTLPMTVLMDHYWKDDYAEKIPGFTEHLLNYYSMWQNDELDMEELKKDLWEYGGVRLEEGEME